MNRYWPSFASAVAIRPSVEFNAVSEEIGLGSATLFFGRYSAQSVHRTTRLLHADGLDHLGLCINLDGVMRGENYVLPRGGMLLTDLTQELIHDATACRAITIALPRQLVEESGIDPRTYNRQAFEPAQAALLRSHLIQLRRSAPQLAAADGPLLLRTVVDLLKVTLHDSGRPVAVSSEIWGAGIKLKAHDLIERHIGQVTLTSTFLCRHLKISRSTLYRVFDDDGGVQAYIRNRRLELSRLALLDSSSNDPVRDIAERYGFGDPAYFSRAFHQRFGLSPRDFRIREGEFDR